MKRWIVLLAGALAACQTDGEDPVVTSELLRMETNQVAIGLEHFVTSEGVRRAHLLADTAYFIEDATSVDLQGVQVTFYDEHGRVSSVLTSREGTYDWETGDMTGRDDVVIIDPNEGRRIETSVIHYDRRRERIWSDEQTRMFEVDGTVVEGSAFESDPGLDEVDLESARLVQPGAGQRTEP
jgi:LPS export ABC transporter protein LptC